MLIHPLSDLHLEFGDWTPRVRDADVTVVAGDLHSGTKKHLHQGVAWCAEHFGGPVLYVPGNHCYYRHRLPRSEEKIRDAAAGTNVVLLQNECFVTRGVRFLGTTLWTDLALHGEPRLAIPVIEKRRAYEQGMNDYHYIRISPDNRKLRASDTMALHRRAVRWLEDEFDRPFDGPTVVVTHHAPSARSLAPGTEDDPVSAAYASNLDDLVERSGAALWIHGHTHHPVDYMIGETRVVSNPRGYADAVAAGFRDDLVLELSP